MTTFATIVADPPWPTNSARAGRLTGRAGFGDAYDGAPTRPLAFPTMSIAAICALPVAALAAQDAHLYLWTINGFVDAAFDVVDAWGFSFSTLLVWAKNTMGGGMGGDAFGISTEFLLYARRGQPAARNRHGGTWFNWQRRYDERGKPCHSKKPDGAYALIEHVSRGPFVELFSREDQPRLGWSYWGNESLATAELAL